MAIREEDLREIFKEDTKDGIWYEKQERMYTFSS